MRLSHPLLDVQLGQLLPFQLKIRQTYRVEVHHDG